jgi:hypothetical protein
MAGLGAYEVIGWRTSRRGAAGNLGNSDRPRLGLLAVIAAKPCPWAQGYGVKGTADTRLCESQMDDTGFSLCLSWAKKWRRCELHCSLCSTDMDGENAEVVMILRLFVSDARAPWRSCRRMGGWGAEEQWQVMCGAIGLWR